jgi:hypothetical protein
VTSATTSYSENESDLVKALPKYPGVILVDWVDLKPFGSEEMTGISPIFPLAIRIILALVIF